MPQMGLRLLYMAFFAALKVLGESESAVKCGKVMVPRMSRVLTPRQ